MRKRVYKVIDIINDQHELTSKLITDNPFSKKSKQGKSRNIDLAPHTVVEDVDAEEKDSDQSTSSRSSTSSSVLSDYLPSELDTGLSLEHQALHLLGNGKEASMRGKPPKLPMELRKRTSSIGRRHNSQIVRGGAESSKWLQEYSLFNLQQQESSLLNNIGRNVSSSHYSPRSQLGDSESMVGMISEAMLASQIETQSVSHILAKLDKNTALA